MEDNMEITDKTTAIYEIALGIASVTLELMEDSVDWQLEDFPQDGEEYSAIYTLNVNGKEHGKQTKRNSTRSGRHYSRINGR